MHALSVGEMWGLKSLPNQLLNWLMQGWRVVRGNHTTFDWGEPHTQDNSLSQALKNPWLNQNPDSSSLPEKREEKRASVSWVSEWVSGWVWARACECLGERRGEGWRVGGWEVERKHACVYDEQEGDWKSCGAAPFRKMQEFVSC